MNFVQADMPDFFPHRDAGQSRPRSQRWWPVLAPIPFLVVAGAVLVPSVEPGSFSAHMAWHIASMNVVAPLCALAWARCMPQARATAGTFWTAAVIQIAMLWIWHLPAVQAGLSHGHGLSILSHIALFISALLFWTSLLRLDGAARWHGVLALLISGKLFCLLGALLVFAPRTLYGGHAAPQLADQQLAGLLMIAACPLSYVLAGIVLTVQLVGPTPWPSHANAQV